MLSAPASLALRDLHKQRAGPVPAGLRGQGREERVAQLHLGRPLSPEPLSI